MTRRNSHLPPVRDATGAGVPLRVELEFGSPFELLIGLYALGTPDEERLRSWVPRLPDCTRATRDALQAVGERAGEVWLHLLGLALETEAEDASGFVEAVAGLKPLELRRHLVGAYVPAWVGLLGEDVLERAARGERGAARRLLSQPRYYGGRARESLGLLLPLTPAETKRRLVAALRAFAEEVFSPHEGGLRAELAADVAAKRLLAERMPTQELVTAAARGYVYEPEPEFTRVALVPHVAARPWILLCQHRDTRIVCYAVPEPPELDPERATADRLARLGRALGDAKRVAILLRLRNSEATFAELAEEVGLARSTTHHHLAQLRAAGLIALRGNARGYRYALSDGGFEAAATLLGGFAPASGEPSPAPEQQLPPASDAATLRPP